MVVSADRQRRGEAARVAEFGALGAAMYWGSTYLLTQRATEDLTPAALTFLLFATCALLSVPVAVRALRATSRSAGSPTERAGLARSGAILGVFTGVGFLAQTVGLQLTSTSRIGFITGMAAVIVPIVELVVFRRRTTRAVLTAIGFGLLGLYLLTGADAGFGIGDAVAFVTPVAYACWTVAASRFAHRYPPIALNCFSFAVTALVALPAAVASGLGRLTVYAVGFIVGMGVTEVLITALCVWVAGRISPSRFELLQLLEPVVAASLGFAVGERIGPLGIVGALFILGALVLVEVIGSDPASEARRAAPTPGVRFVRTEVERQAWEEHRYRLHRWTADAVRSPLHTESDGAHQAESRRLEYESSWSDQGMRR